MEKVSRYSRSVKFIFLSLDILIVYAAYRLSFFAHHGQFHTFDRSDYSLMVVFILAWIVVGFILNIYRIGDLTRFRRVAGLVVMAFTLHAIFIAFYVSAVGSEPTSIMPWASTYVTSVVAVLFGRRLLITLYRLYRRRTRTARKIAIVGKGKTALMLQRFFDHNPILRCQVVGVFDDSYRPTAPGKLLTGSVEELKELCRSEEIEEIYFTRHDQQQLQELSALCDEHFILFRLVPDYQEIFDQKLNIYYQDEIPILMLRPEPMHSVINMVIKRTFDIVFSMLVLLTIFPFLYIIIALLIKIESPGPVLFRQLRAGRKNKLFLCYKFRTMRTDNDDEARQATKNDPRVTRIGAFLRKTSLDEFPQFINVLLGDMSVVGPRPFMLQHVEEFSRTVDRYALRQFVTPGITGYAQVNGFRGEVRHAQMIEKRVEYDRIYIENWSLMLDVKIIWLTVRNIFKGEENAY